LISLAAFALVLTSCGEPEKAERGFRYMPDMYQSPALKSLEAYRLYEKNEDGEVVTIREVPGMLSPVPGTIPRGFVPYQIAKDDIAIADETLVNPLPITPQTLRLGQVKYATFCAACHGTDGNAKNNYLGDRLTGVPNINAVDFSDGHFYHVITHGIRRMPNYKSQLLPEERWAVIHYIRGLQKAATLSKEESARLLAEEKSGIHDDYKMPPAPIPEYKANEWPEFAQ
jgi:mono/diheme cytochrome c family protein